VIILAVLNVLCVEAAFGQNIKKAEIKSAGSVETAVNKSAARETGQAGLKKEAGKKKKLSLKTTIYIFDTIVSGLMHLLIGAGFFMIVLMILKWFFLERRVEK